MGDNSALRWHLFEKILHAKAHELPALRRLIEAKYNFKGAAAPAAYTPEFVKDSIRLGIKPQVEIDTNLTIENLIESEDKGDLEEDLHVRH